MNHNLNIVLVEPQIPQNTGNIVRLCSCTNSKLFLVGKLGFSISEKQVRRAGLDYWDEVDIKQYPTLESLQKEFPNNAFYYLTTKTNNLYTKMDFKKGDFLVFGAESKGLPEELLFANPDKCLTIPMAESRRSLNLSNSVSIVLYEAIRQLN